MKRGGRGGQRERERERETLSWRRQARGVGARVQAATRWTYLHLGLSEVVVVAEVVVVTQHVDLDVVWIRGRLRQWVQDLHIESDRSQKGW